MATHTDRQTYMPSKSCVVSSGDGWAKKIKAASANDQRPQPWMITFASVINDVNVPQVMEVDMALYDRKAPEANGG